MGNIIKKLKRNKSKNRSIISVPEMTWTDEEGIHFIGSGDAPDSNDIKKITDEYQQLIRKSPLWKQMVQQYGKKQAEVMLKDFQVKPG